MAEEGDNSSESIDAPAEEEHVPPPAAARARKRGSIQMSASALSAMMRGGRKEMAAVPMTVESAPTDLWTESYNSLRDSQSLGSLTLAYESLLTKYLPNQLKQGNHDAPFRAGSDHERADLMLAIVRGCVNKKQVDQSDDEAEAMLASCRKTLAGIMSAQPVYAASWAGFCSLTPVRLASWTLFQPSVVAD